MDELGGRPHWGKRHFQTAATLRARYPDWDRFQAVRARLDPSGRFANAWTDRVLGPVRAMSTTAARRSADGAPATAADASAYERLERATAGAAGAVRARRPRRAVSQRRATWNAAPRGKPIRLASKSLRCRALQERVLARDGFRGTLAFTLPEALWLAAHGADDILVAYPTADAAALRELAERVRRRGAGGRADRGDGRQRRAARADRARAASADGAARVRVCIDIDAGWRALGGRVRVGVKRSPVHTPEQAAALARGDRRARAPAAGRDDGVRGADRRCRRRAARAGRCARARSARCRRARRASCARRRAAVVAAVAGGAGARRARRRWSSSTAAARAASSAPRARPP